MKKRISLFLCLLLTLTLLTGCGKKDYLAEESTLYILKNGSVISTDVEDFPTDTYNLEGLTDYVNDMIDAYNEENGKDSVSLYQIEEEDGTCTLCLKYKTVDDYNAFTGNNLFVGSLAEALAAGYSFDDSYASVDGDTATACQASAFTDATSYKCVFLDAAYNVHVYGTVYYTSVSNTAIVDKNTISFALGNTLNGVDVTESTEAEAVETTEAAETTEAVDSASDGAVGEDEFEMDTEETVVFEFEEETDDTTTEQELGTVTVIFK